MPSSANGEARERRSAAVSDTTRARFPGCADAALFLLLSALAAVLLIQLLDFGSGRDQAIYSLVADTALRGGIPYRDVWDFKPPGIYAVYAAARGIFGPSIVSVRILEALGLLSWVFAFAIFSRRHVGSRRAGVLAAVVAILAYVPLEFWYTGQPEGFGAVALAWALVCASYEPARAAGRRGRRRQFAAWTAAAALYCSAALLKPPLGGGILVSFAFVVTRRRQQDARSGWRRALGAPAIAFTLGGLLPLLATLGGFAAAGALRDGYEALFLFAPQYTALQLETLSTAELIGRTLDGWLLQTAPFNLVGLAALSLLPAVGPRERPGIAHVLGVVAFSLVGVALQAKFFRYHFAAVLPLTGMLAGWGYWKLWLRARRSTIAVLALAAGLAGIHLGAVPGLASLDSFWERSQKRMCSQADPERRLRVRDSLYSLGDVDARSNRAVAAWLAANTPEDSRLFVWGFEPVLYEWSGRRPASRYIYNVPQRASWSMSDSRAELMSTLEASPPAAIVLVHGDRLPQVTGNPRDSFESLQEFSALRDLLRRRYRHAKRIGDLEIRLRDDLAAPPRPATRGVQRSTAPERLPASASNTASR